MNCKQVEELLPLYAGRDLEEKRATLVTEHLQTCAACAYVADEYRESVQLTEQFAAPVFSEAVYAGMRQHVLREIEAEAMATPWSQSFTSLFRPRLTWAIASVLLIVVSMFAIYFIVNRRNDERQLADERPVKVEPGTKDRNERESLPPSEKRDEKKPRLAGVPQAQRKRFRDALAERMSTIDAKSPDTLSTANNNNLPEPTLFPPRDSTALDKTMRVEIQTKDPKIRIIWFVQQEDKPVIPSSKGI